MIYADIKNSIKSITIILGTALLLTACGGEPEANTPPVIEPIDSVTESDTAAGDTPGSGDGAGTISTDTALSAVRNYYMTTTGSQDDSDKGAYWDVSTNEAGEIVVLYRSYTGSINRFYVNAESGDAYVTEQVPGIIDDEQKTGESFNVRSYIQ